MLLQSQSNIPKLYTDICVDVLKLPSSHPNREKPFRYVASRLREYARQRRMQESVSSPKNAIPSASEEHQQKVYASIKIQANYRGARDRERTQRIRHLTSNSNQAADRNEEEKEINADQIGFDEDVNNEVYGVDEELAATKIQSVYRMKTVQDERNKEEEAASKIQIAYRERFTGETNEVSNQPEAEVQLQEHEGEETIAATKIQSVYRGKRAKHQVTAMQEERNMEEAAVRIQCKYRQTSAKSEVASRRASLLNNVEDTADGAEDDNAIDGSAPTNEEGTTHEETAPEAKADIIEKEPEGKEEPQGQGEEQMDNNLEEDEQLETNVEEDEKKESTKTKEENEDEKNGEEDSTTTNLASSEEKEDGQEKKTPEEKNSNEPSKKSDNNNDASGENDETTSPTEQESVEKTLETAVPSENDNDQAQAATKIQSVYRGKRDRKSLATVTITEGS